MAAPKKNTKSVSEGDTKIFRPEEHEVTTIDGTKVKIPKISWKKEIDLLRIIQHTIDEVKFDPADDAVDDSVLTMVNRVLQVAPNRVTEFIAVVLGQPSEWCEDNLDSAEILGVIIPLLRSRLDLIMEKVTPFMPQVQATQTQETVVPIQATPSTGSTR